LNVSSASRALPVELYRYAIPFTEPMPVKGQVLNEREGIIIVLKSEDGQHRGYGEIAPLPGLHDETLQDAEAQMNALLSKKSTMLFEHLPESLAPSVRTGIEMALLNLEAATSGIVPFSEHHNLATHVPVNALLFGDTPMVLERADAYFAMGYRTFKLKVNARNTAAAIGSITALHNTFGNSIELRLDANQSLSLDEAVAFAKKLPTGSIAYIEEPLLEAAQIGDFYAATGICSALDETLWQEPELLKSTPQAALAALILKPNRIGGISKAMHFARYAHDHHLHAIFSSAFESGISLSFYAVMAAATAATPSACGLDTYRYLQHDLLETPFGADHALLDVQQLYRAGCTIQMSSLRRI